MMNFEQLMKENERNSTENRLKMDKMKKKKRKIKNK